MDSHCDLFAVLLVVLYACDTTCSDGCLVACGFPRCLDDCIYQFTLRDWGLFVAFAFVATSRGSDRSATSATQRRHELPRQLHRNAV